ncbi:MAG TPA: hypothetical protein VK119_10930 [Bacillota bacterium]|nr:hypothetical protein [Bacillota bacterium]
MNKRIEFALSVIFFWVQGHLSVDNRFVKVTTANTILGLFPAGKDSQTIPLKNISSTKLSSKYKILPMFLGLIILLTTLPTLGRSFGSLIFFLIGGVLFCSGILTTLIIQRSGNDYYISVPFFEKNKLVQAQNAIEEAMAEDVDKTDLNQFFDKKTEA